ncbi:hypothetical protein QVH35_11040 [Candidatus Nitrosotenuis chungbukensis]|uniref:hypothetical protein n=1 Tax=Candidatus Nitrosotenuis chungbukensis TaxID=1353246 RepID=UPI0015A5A63E|nr:hypothetical protein [Candidatus Nitrosotenuis chungbukensis]WKT57818.1 hypothetical protein QVH35_11040 [Candidatus Nitrosotenuis chungbukensis]
MNCKRCHHIAQIHESSTQSDSLMRLGKCAIPGCTCKQYLDSIERIDDELL